jgi:hypothetical protein
MSSALVAYVALRQDCYTVKDRTEVLHTAHAT